MDGAATFDFIFETGEQFSRAKLQQGDLLKRTDRLAEAINQAHSYYADAPDYSHFLVLTQTCDLVRRKGGRCNSRYITICAVRPLSLFVARQFESYTQPLDGCPVPIGDRANKVLAQQFLGRIVNNTVDGMFFIPKGTAPTVDEHLCAFLPLSIALQVGHYDTCLTAKVAQVKEIFAAKIGWLAGNQYSRVATPDIHENNDPGVVKAFMDQFFDELGYSSVMWLSPFERSVFEERIAESLKLTGRDELTPEETTSLLKGLPKEHDKIAERVVDVLIERNLFDNDPEKVRRAKNFLLNDAHFKKLTKSLSKIPD